MPRLFVLAALLGLVACGPPNSAAPPQTPGALSVAYQWHSGPVAPPYVRTETIDVAPSGEGRLASARGAVEHEVAFRLSPEQMQALYADLRAAGLYDGFAAPDGPPRAGGATWELTVTADGQTTTVPRAVARRDEDAKERIGQAITAAVPASARADMDAWIAATEPSGAD